MKDFTYWRNEITKATSAADLKGVGESLARFQGQTELISDGEKRLNPEQLKSLRKIYSKKMKDFDIHPA